jgi:hypothetical protein
MKGSFTACETLDYYPGIFIYKYAHGFEMKLIFKCNYLSKKEKVYPVKFEVRKYLTGGKV